MNHIKDFLFLNLADYENFGIQLPIGAILIFLCFGMIAFAFYYNYSRSCASHICLRLLRSGAVGEEHALSLKDLRLADSIGVKMALKGGGELRSIVKTAGEEKQTYEEYIAASRKKGAKNAKQDISLAAFYIAAERRDRAEKLAAENHSILTPVILSVILLAILLLATMFLPDLLTYLNEL